MSGEVDSRPCFFIGMELLDNLPHDKIAWVVPTYSEEHGESGATTRSKASSSSPEEGKRNLTELQLCEAVVVKSPDDGGFREVFRPLRDPLIRELLAICPELATAVKNRKEPSNFSSGAAESKSESPSFLGRTFAELFGAVGGLVGGGALLRPEHCAAFVPTGSLRLVQALRKRLPRHRAILADFDSFAGSAGAGRGGADASDPGAGKPGRSDEAAAVAATTEANDESLTAFQAPIVSSRNPATGGVTDHATYMVPLGSADIFFPTCFERLSRLHATVCKNAGGTGGSNSGGEVVRRGRGLVVKQGEFLREFADLRATRTFSGFNPLVDDFRNSSVFFSGAVVVQ